MYSLLRKTISLIIFPTIILFLANFSYAQQNGTVKIEKSTKTPEFAKHYNNGNTLFRSHKFSDAIAEYEKAVELKPDYSEAYWAMGLCYENMRNKQKAIESFTKAIDANPSFAKAYAARGSVYLKEKNYKKAIADYKKATEYNPRNEKNHFKLGFAYASSGDYKNAIISYNKAVQWKDDYSKAYYNLGDCYSKLGNLKKAEWAYSNAARTRKNYYKAYYKLAEVRKAEKDFQGAERAVKKCLEIKPSDAGAMVLYGEILEGQGKTGSAMAQYKKAINDPNWGPTAKYKIEQIKARSE